MDDASTALLTTLGEAGGIMSMLAIVIGLLIRMIKRNGCTCKFYNCSGGPLVEVDCEEGAPGKRYLPKQTSTPDTNSGTPTQIDVHVE